jgi:hypothetical protein
MIYTWLAWYTEVHAPILLLRNPYPYSLNFPLTYLESLLCAVARIPVHSDPWLAVYWPPPFLPIPFFPSTTVSHFKYMSSYDDIAISASHSLIQFPPLAQLNKIQEKSLLRWSSARASSMASVFPEEPLCRCYTLPPSLRIPDSYGAWA